MPRQRAKVDANQQYLEELILAGIAEKMEKAIPAFTLASDPFTQGLERQDALDLRLTQTPPEKALQAKYHKTPHFNALKVFAISIHKKCQLCPKKDKLTFHHTTYKTLFNENIFTDGIVVCHRCHSKLHRKR